MILEKTAPDDETLAAAEQRWIDVFSDVYNSSLRVTRTPPTMLGKKHTTVTREKMRESALERYQKSNGHSEATRAKMSAQRLGKPTGPFTQEHRDKIAIGRTGKRHTAETKAIISAKNKGKPGFLPSPETIAKRNATRERNKAARNV